MLRASLGASALAAVVVLGWGCGLSVKDSNFASGGSGQGGVDAQGGGGARTVGHGGGAQGGAAGTGGKAMNGGAGPGTGGGAQGGAGQGGAGQGGGAHQGGAGQGGAGNAGPGGGGPGPGPGAGGGSNCPGLGDACSDCAATECTAAYCSCYGNLACDQLAQCFAQCAQGDMTCYQSCETQDSGGISAFYLLDNCTAGACASQCPGTVALTACQVCLFTSCDTEMNTCLANPACAAILACVAQCSPSNATCPQQCATQHPTGVADADAVAQCSNTHCTSSCP